MKILTGGQFRELDLYTIEHEPIASIDLMERASRAIADEILRTCTDEQQRIIIFCGPGGNGGDGLAVARMLLQAERNVTAYLFNVTGHISPDCATNRDRLRELNEDALIEVISELTFPDLHPDDLVIDALFGTGLSKPLSGGFALVTKRINQSNATIVSIDVPSGLMCEDNTYNDTSFIIRASRTLSIQVPKLAFLFPENHRFVGDVQLLDIGLSQKGLECIKSHLWMTEEPEARALLRRRSPFAHKGSMGHALLVAGHEGMTGAAILSTRAALRTGAGKVTVQLPRAALNIMQTAVPEAIVQTDVDESIITTSLDAADYQALGIGPGIGTDRYTAAALHSYLRQQACPMVIDADAINILAENPEWLREVPADSILTPHPGELDRLVGHCTNSYERLTRARNFAINFRVFLIVKGHYTQICTPTGGIRFNTTGNAGMATAGSGDVLTGIITSLLAQGCLPAEAAQLGVYLHGLAGDLAAADLSEEALIASDIINHLPAAFKQLKTP